VGTVLAVLGVLAVLFVAALVATRDGELLVDAPRDRADLDLPADGPVRGDDLERVRFPMALRGYRMQEVDDLLDRVSAELRERDARIAELEAGRSGAGDEPDDVAPAPTAAQG
jgi:DivIVA domain-containing protein